MELKQLGGLEIRKVSINETRMMPLSEEAAQREYFVAERYGIKAEMYEKDGILICPQVNAEKPGTGMFSQFLGDLKRACAFRGKKLAFEAVVNEHLYKYLEYHEIPVMVKGELYNVETENEIDFGGKEELPQGTATV